MFVSVENPRMTRRRAVLGLAAVGLLAACGGPSSGGPVAQILHPLSTFGAVADLGKAVDVQRRTDQTVRMLVSGSVAGGASLDGVGAWRVEGAGSSTAFTEQVSRPGGTSVDISLVLAGGRAYAKPSDLSSLPAGKSWVEIGTATRDPFYRQFVPLVDTLREQTDPTALLARWGSVVTIANSAEDSVGSTRAVRYELRPVAGKQAPAIDMWVDGTNRLLRMTVVQPGAAPSGPGSLDARYQDWGKPVVIAQPEPRQVAVL